MRAHGVVGPHKGVDPYLFIDLWALFIYCGFWDVWNEPRALYSSKVLAEFGTSRLAGTRF